MNKKCKIICRCFNDSIAEVLEKTFDCKIISTSYYAANFILSEITEKSIKNIIIVGYTNVTRRLIDRFQNMEIKYKIIEKNKNLVTDIIDDGSVIVGDAKDKDRLIEAGIHDADMAIVLVDRADEVIVIADKAKELKKDCHLICRFFHEDVGAILEKPPFNAKVISQSKHALEKIIEEGIFEFKTIPYL
ncbi:MAG: NAD-binding protein [Candidatus Helarchaeota archaeon]